MATNAMIYEEFQVIPIVALQNPQYIIIQIMHHIYRIKSVTIQFVRRQWWLFPILVHEHEIQDEQLSVHFSMMILWIVVVVDPDCISLICPYNQAQQSFDFQVVILLRYMQFHRQKLIHDMAMLHHLCQLLESVDIMNVVHRVQQQLMHRFQHVSVDCSLLTRNQYTSTYPVNGTLT
jgi:hypothetical protein